MYSRDTKTPCWLLASFGADGQWEDMQLSRRPGIVPAPRLIFGPRPGPVLSLGLTGSVVYPGLS